MDILFEFLMTQVQKLYISYLDDSFLNILQVLCCECGTHRCNCEE